MRLESILLIPEKNSGIRMDSEQNQNHQQEASKHCLVMFSDTVH